MFLFTLPPFVLTVLLETRSLNALCYQLNVNLPILYSIFVINSRHDFFVLVIIVFFFLFQF